MQNNVNFANIKFSIIVPVYKVEQYLDRCVQSILQQPYSNWEMILVDDGSPDNCGAMCDAYAQNDPRVRVIHQDNQGLSCARNAGLDKATGTHILFVDSDDWLEPNALHTVTEYLIETDVDILWFNVYNVFNDRKESFLNLHATRDFDSFLRNFLEKYYGMRWSAGDKVYKAGVFKDIRFTKGLKYEDSFIFPEILQKGATVRIIDDYLYYYYRENSGSILHTISKDPKDDYYFFCVHKEWCKYLQSRNKSLYEILIVSALNKAIKAYNINLGTHYLSAEELQEVNAFLSENKQYFNKLALGKRILCFGWQQCKLINQIKAVEYRLKYR